ncbi:MAG: PQQ-dependent sugar dehydrogenase [Opitutaceae bacterium]|tara:strand:+ start:5652 stop:8108 length:2457 start_codon:yes stop_codon:yes gene_type:complete
MSKLSSVIRLINRVLGAILLGSGFVLTAHANWFLLHNRTASATGGSKLVAQSDGTFYATYRHAIPSLYTVESEWTGGTFHGLRLQALTDGRLPNGGPGWAPHGNFILSRVEISYFDSSNKAVSIPLAHAYTDHEQDGWMLDSAISGDNPDTGWAIAGALSQIHQAYFAPKVPVFIPHGSRLRITMRQGTPDFPDHQIGRFRLDTTNDPVDVALYFAIRLRRVVLDDSPLDPFELAVAKDGRLFYIERLGAIKRSLPDQRSSITVGQLEVFSQLDDGLIGFTLDPDFTKNGWMYLCYSAPDVSENRVSRFTLRGDSLDLDSEHVLLRIPVQRDAPPCHTGGSLAFDAQGNLLISTGDNINPFDSDGYNPVDERPERAAWDAQSSAGNTLDLRGKILRIIPQPDGSYTIPEGNLFDATNAKARPEIYVMGCRNPFRLSVDQQTNTVYWGEVGPDARSLNPQRGPAGYDEINQARTSGNYGWPFFVADNQPYSKYNYATKITSGSWDPTAVRNDSPHNSGLRDLPAAQPSLISYTYSHSPDTLLLGVGGRCAMAGPVYYFDPALDSAAKLPAEFDRHLFFYDWMRGRIIAAKLDENEQPIEYRRILSGVPIRRPMDLELGPDGALYLIEWGTKYNGGNADAVISRIEAIPPGQIADESWNNSSKQTDAASEQNYLDALTRGDPINGEALLRNAHHLSCVNCHRLEGHGGVAGPAFDDMGSRLSPAELLEAILHPARTISPGYGLIAITQQDDTVIAGVLIGDTADTLEIETPDRGLVIVKVSEIADRSGLTSTMPAFNGVLTPAEAADLVAYLQTRSGSKE